MKTIISAIIAIGILFIVFYIGFSIGVIRGGKEMLKHLDRALKILNYTNMQQLELFKALKEALHEDDEDDDEEEQPAPPTFEQSQGEQQ